MVLDNVSHLLLSLHDALFPVYFLFALVVRWGACLPANPMGCWRFAARCTCSRGASSIATCSEVCPSLLELFVLVMTEHQLPSKSSALLPDSDP